MALIAFIVVWENITSLMRGAKFWEKWENTRYPDEESREPKVSRAGTGEGEKGVEPL